MSPNEQELSWRVASHRKVERTNDWYWTVGILVLIGCAASIYLGNFLLAVILIIGSCTIVYLSRREPREHTIVIDKRGIMIDGTRYPYKSIRSFWIEHEAVTPKLYLSFSGVLLPHFSLALDNKEEADQAREYLRHHVEEIEQGPSMGEHLVELLGL